MDKQKTKTFRQYLREGSYFDDNIVSDNTTYETTDGDIMSEEDYKYFIGDPDNVDKGTIERELTFTDGSIIREISFGKGRSINDYFIVKYGDMANKWAEDLKKSSRYDG